MRGAVAVVRRTVLASAGLALSASLILTPAGGAWAIDTNPNPIGATRTTKALNVPEYPAKSRLRGKRIVYDKALMTIWLISEDEQVVALYPVVGRPDRPSSGNYRVYSKSPSSANRLQELTFKNMVRFARGPSTGAPIGFHDIPRTYDRHRGVRPNVDRCIGAGVRVRRNWHRGRGHRLDSTLGEPWWQTLPRLRGTMDSLRVFAA